MVEKVARKLVQKLSEIPADDGLLDRLPDEDRDAALRISFALIVAMREPTEAMMHDGVEIYRAFDVDNDPCMILQIWRAMFDEALK